MLKLKHLYFLNLIYFRKLIRLEKLAESGINYHCENMYDSYINLFGQTELNYQLKLDEKLAKNYRKLHDHKQLIELDFIKDLFIALTIFTSISIVVFIIELINDLSQLR